MHLKRTSSGGEQSSTKSQWISSRIIFWLVFAIALGWLAYVLVDSLLS